MAALINNLGGLAGFGENVLAVGDNTSTQIPQNDPNSENDFIGVFGAEGLSIFGLVSLKTAYVNNNGNITFTQAFPNSGPISLGSLPAPVFAPFWADVDTSGVAGAATPGGNSTGSNRVYYDLDIDNHTFTVTWDDVGYWNNHTDPKNAFQLQIVDVGTGNFDLIYRYESINWISGDFDGGTAGLGGLPARAGFSLYNGANLELPASNDRDALLALDETVGNTGEAGVYKYSFRSGSPLVPVTPGNPNPVQVNDTVNGTSGDDVLADPGGNDTLSGGAGNDLIFAGPTAGGTATDIDTYTGGAGIDTISYETLGGAVTVNLALTVAQGTNAGGHVITGIENLIGSNFNDSLAGNASANMIWGRAGRDTVSGGGDKDTLDGGTNDDILNGQAGDDTLTGGANDDILNGGDGIDTASYGDATTGVNVSLAITGAFQNTGGAGSDKLDSIENLSGSRFNDTLIGDNNDNVLAGGEGNDNLQGAGGNDVLEGGLGTDTLTGGEGNDTFRYTASQLTGADTVDGGNGIDAVRVTTLAVLTDAILTGVSNVETFALAADLPGQSISFGSTSQNAGISAVDLTAITGAANGVTVNLQDRTFGVTVTGGAGNDVILAPISSVEPDNYSGGSGDDTFELGTLSSADMLVGGANTTVGDGIVLRTTADINDDDLSGVSGVERLVLSDQVAAQSVQLGEHSEDAGIQVLDASSATNVVNVDASARTDAITILGGSFDDFITAGGGGNNIQSGDGDDIFVFTNAAFNLAPTVDGGAHEENGGDQIRISDRAQIADAAFQHIVNVEELHLTGGDGESQFVELGANSEDAGIVLVDVSLGSGTTVDLAERFDHIRVVGGSGDETFVFSSASFNAGHTIEGGGGDDRIVIEDAANVVDEAFEDITGVGTLELSATASAQSVALEDDAEAAGIDVVDGTALTGALTVTVADRFSPISISGGSGDDSFRFTSDSFSFAPTVDGGDGTDELRFTDGVFLSDDAFGSLTSIERVALSDGIFFSQSVSLGENSESAGIVEVDASGVQEDDVTIDASDRELGITIRGGQSSNELFGGSGGDTFYAGGENAFTDMAGGAGDDAYHVFSFEGQHNVIEFFNDGEDTVFVDFDQNYNLSDDQFVEHMVFTVNANNGGRGNSLNNQLTANAGNNYLVGMDGNDTLSGEAGNDSLWGGNDNGSSEGFDGDDLLRGGAGEDDMWGGTGDDTLEGGADADDMWGGDGVDTLDGGTGADDMRGGDGDDVYFVDNVNDIVREDIGAGSGEGDEDDGLLHGFDLGNLGDMVRAAVSYALSGLAAGVENLTLKQGAAAALNATGNALDNAITGNELGNLILGGEGDDVLDGGEGTDTAVFTGNRADYAVGEAGDSVTVTSAAEGTDTLTNIEKLQFADGVMQLGGASDDTYFSFPGTAEFFFGGNGTDTVSYVNATSAVTVSLAVAVAQNTGGAGTDTLESVENLTGSGFNDALTGDGGDNVLNGGAGNDNLVGGLGNDTYFVGQAGDTVSEAIDGGTDLVRSTVSHVLGANVENLTLLGTAAINATGNALDNVLTGNSGNNTLNGGAGNDTASYAGVGAGVTVNLGLTAAQTTGGAGRDTLLSIESLVGTAFNDVLTGNAGSNTLAGLAGNDTIAGGAGNDILDGGSGNDTASYAGATAGVTVSLSTPGAQATGGGGTDTILGIENLTGTALNDALTGDDLANVLNGGAGNDVLDGRGGVDTMIGGAGNDTYEVDSTLDVVTEAAAAGTDLVRSSVDWTLAATLENLTLIGSGNINATGNAVNNVLESNSGNNTLDGGLGIDTASYASAINGVTVSLAVAGQQNTTGAGSDTLIGIENLTGSASNDKLTGNASSNALSGGAGNDTLDGGGGSDTMAGGAGDDVYFVDTAGDMVTEGTNGGTDTVVSAVTYTLAANVEVLELSGDGNISATGNTGNNLLIGTSGNNTLNGGAGNDTASYADASSAVVINLTLAVQAMGVMGQDRLIGIENLIGGDHNDTLIGNTLANILDGGAGNDNLFGGAGNDTYLVDSELDSIVENPNAGTDLVLATADFVLYENVENLTLLGTGDFFGAGTDAANVLTGNGGDNELLGLEGNDTLEGGQGNDLLDGNDGIDTASYAAAGAGVTVDLSIVDGQITSAAGTDTLIDIENLTGSSFDDALTGDGDSNVLNGGAGNDTLAGGAGNDVLNGGADTDTASYAGNATAVTVSLAIATAQNTVGAGTDTLAAMENLAGSAHNDLLTGNAGANTVSGNTGNDTLSGAAGNDTLNGGADNDTLIGGAGNDALNGDAGTDTASYAGNLTAVTVSLAIATAQNTVGAGADTLASIENLTGSSFNDTLTGDGGNNVLDGAGGNDLLTGGLGEDTLNGGTGTDTASYAGSAAGVTVSLALAGAQITAGAGTDTLVSIENLTGSASNDLLTGDVNANRLTGGGGNDLLDGGLGTDTLVGGAGDDVYLVNVAGDMVIEAANGGLDTVRSTATSYTLAANVEFLILEGSGNIGGTGNTLNNVLTGNSGNNKLDGGAGIDTVSYSGVTSGGVTVNLAQTTAQNTGNAGMDTLASIENVIGSGFDDVLRGNTAANLLDGGDGNDQMSGGTGNDTYMVNAGGDTGDKVNENANAGIDTVISTVSYTLGDNVENLTLMDGSGNINATGNGLANVLMGNSGNNVLDGGDGIDTVSYASSDSDVEVDLSLGTAVGDGADTLISIDNVTGSIFNDILGGTAGNNVINGGGGFDAVSYHAANAGVTINLAFTKAQNTVGAGSDTLISIEDVLGSDHNDMLLGTSGANRMDGGAGADLLRGLGGADVLTGGDGADIFDYNALGDSGITEATRDIITDFVSGSGDKIDLRDIDANASVTGNQAFAFVGGAEFANGSAAGLLRFDSANHILYGSTDADALPEFSILLIGVNSLVAGVNGDFFL